MRDLTSAEMGDLAGARLEHRTRRACLGRLGLFRSGEANGGLIASGWDHAGRNIAGPEKLCTTLSCRPTRSTLSRKLSGWLLWPRRESSIASLRPAMTRSLV